MTLEEAIKHTKEISRNVTICKECRNEHKLLYGWLNELKKRRNRDKGYKIFLSILDNNSNILILNKLIYFDRIEVKDLEIKFIKDNKVNLSTRVIEDKIQQCHNHICNLLIRKQDLYIRVISKGGYHIKNINGISY